MGYINLNFNSLWTVAFQNKYDPKVRNSSLTMGLKIFIHQLQIILYKFMFRHYYFCCCLLFQSWKTVKWLEINNIIVYTKHCWLSWEKYQSNIQQRSVSSIFLCLFITSCVLEILSKVATSEEKTVQNSAKLLVCFLTNYRKLLYVKLLCRCWKQWIIIMINL